MQFKCSILRAYNSRHDYYSSMLFRVSINLLLMQTTLIDESLGKYTLGVFLDCKQVLCVHSNTLTTKETTVSIQWMMSSDNRNSTSFQYIVNKFFCYVSDINIKQTNSL